MILLPVLEFNGRVILLANVLQITDESTAETSVVTVCGRNGVEIQFFEADADELLKEVERLLLLCDSLAFPLVGVGNKVLILPNFLLFDIDDGDPIDGPDGEKKITLTDDVNQDHVFTGQNAAVIIARLDNFTTGTKSLFDQLTGAPAAGLRPVN